MPNLNTVNSNFYKIAVVDGSDNVVGITAAPANVKITGSASAGQTLTADGSGGLAWAAASSSAVTGQYELFASSPPDSTWLPAGGGPYNVSSYPTLGAMFRTATRSGATTSANAQPIPYALAYGGGKYVAIPSGTGTLTARTSTDGVTWTNGGVMPNLGTAQWTTNWCVWNGSVFFTQAAENGKRLATTSPDGVTWTAQTLPVIASTTYYDASCAGGSTGSDLVTLAYNGSVVAKSTDNGVTWTSSAMPITNGAYRFIAYGGGKYITVNGNSGIGYWSTDAVTWTAFTLPAAGGVWGGAKHNGSYWLMGDASNASTTMAISYDGVNWSSIPTPGGVAQRTDRILWTGSRWANFESSTSALRWSQGSLSTTWTSSGIPTGYGGLQVTDGAESVVGYMFSGGTSYYIKYTFTGATTFTAGTNPGVATSSGTWFIKS